MYIKYRAIHIKLVSVIRKKVPQCLVIVEAIDFIFMFDEKSYKDSPPY